MSTGNKPTVQQAAKQGNPRAIAILVNRQLQPKGITAKVSMKASCLQIMLEAATVPNQKGLVTALKKWIDSLGIDSIQGVQIYAKQTGEDIPAWNDSFEVIRKLEEPKTTNTVISPTFATETSKNNEKVEEAAVSELDPTLLELAANKMVGIQTDFEKIAEAEGYAIKAQSICYEITVNKQVYGSNSVLSGATPADVDLGLQYINRSLELFPQEAVYLNIKAQLLYDGKRDILKAIRLLEKAAQINPRSIDIQNNLRTLKKEQKATLERQAALKELGCFIATAAFGTPLAKEVKVLRWWRDNQLLKSRLGRFFVHLYYLVSPPVAEFVAKYNLLRAIIRFFLRPIIMVIKHFNSDIIV